MRTIRRAWAVSILVSGFCVVCADGAVPVAKDSRAESANERTSRPAKKVAEPGLPFKVSSTWSGRQVTGFLVSQYRPMLAQPQDVQSVPPIVDNIVGMLERRECDVGIVFQTSVPDAEKKLSGLGCERFPLGQFVLGVGVNKRNPLRAVTIDELRTLYCLDLVKGPPSWKAIPGVQSMKPVRLYRPSYSGVECELFRKKCLFGDRGLFADEMFGNPDELKNQKPTDKDVLTGIAKHGDAIGFFICKFGKDLDKGIRLLAIAKDSNSAPVLPSETVLANSADTYPLADTLAIYLHPEAPPSAREFCKFAIEGEATTVLEQCDLWPEKKLKEIRASEHLAEAKRGLGALIAIRDITDNNALLKDLGRRYVKDKTAIQLDIEGADGTTQQFRAASPEEARRELQLHRAEALVAYRAVEPLRALKVAPAGNNSTHVRNPAIKLPSSIELGKIAIGVVVHPQNHLKSLTIDEFVAMLRGEVKQWPALSGKAANIHIVGLKRSHPLSHLVQALVAPALKLDREPDNEHVTAAVSRDPAAIGLIDFGRWRGNDHSVKLIPLTDSAGRIWNFTDGKVAEGYPLAQSLLLYVSLDAGGAIHEFADWANSNSCPDVLREHHLLPPTVAATGKRRATTQGPVVDDSNGKDESTSSEPAPDQSPTQPSRDEAAPRVPR